MWAIRKPCYYERDCMCNSSSLFHNNILNVSVIKRDQNEIYINGLNYPYYFSRFILFDNKEEAEKVFNKIQEIRKCMQ